MINLIIIGAIQICLAKQPSFWAEYGKSYHKNNLMNNEDQFAVDYFDQIVDHTTFTSESQATFNQKYLVVSKYWKNQQGPIFFYCGNEGPVEMFYENSGFLNENLAQEFGALVVYAEHRYFGESWPFGDQKTSYLKENIKYLTSEQALQDFVVFLRWFKIKNCPKCQIFAFGGSYGGMLASWLRMKYPNVVDGAIAASAPIYYFNNRVGLDFNIFYKIATNAFTSSSIRQRCPLLIREAFRRIDGYKLQGDYSILNKAFRTCTPITNLTGVLGLEAFLNNGFTYMSMTKQPMIFLPFYLYSYPYETKFLKKLPRWPASTSCEKLVNISITDSDLKFFDGIRGSVEVYYNYENLTDCNEVWVSDQSSDQDMSGWDILACSDMVMPMYSDGINDMFNAQPWDQDAYMLGCLYKFGVSPNLNYTLEHYGGISDGDMLGYSNIFFSNGQLDPWSGGSPVDKISDTIPTNYMKDCSHHLDLRSPNIYDPQAVKDGRIQEIAFLRNLIKIQNIEE